MGSSERAINASRSDGGNGEIAMSVPLLISPKARRNLQRSQSAPGVMFAEFLEKCSEHRELPGPNDGELKREMGSFELTLLGVGACIGAGIFVLTGVEARIAGPSVSLSFCLAAASSVFNGLCYAELSSRLPISGSAYLYAYCMFGELTAMVVVANQLMDYHIGAATMARSLTAYVGKAVLSFGVPLPACMIECQPFPSLPWLSISLGAPLVLLCVTMVVAGGAKTSASVTAAMTVLKMGIVVFVIAAGMQMVDTSRWHPFFPNGMTATLQAAATLNYAFIGYDVIANAAEETKNPQRDIPISIVSALSICATLYLVVCMVLCGMQDFDQIDAAAPVSGAFMQRDMVWVASVINIGAFLGMVTGLLAGLYGQSRIYFALARDDLAPHSLKQPGTCSLWCGCVAGLLATFIDVRELASFLNIGVLLAYSTTAASVLCINAKRRGGPGARSENFWIFLAAGLAVVLSQGGRVWTPLPGLAATGIVLVIAWVSLFREYSTFPGGAFRCPGVPATPLIALVTNVYLATQLSWLAWLRLIVVTIVVSLAFCFFILRHFSLDDRRRAICTTVKAAADAAGTKPGVCHACDAARQESAPQPAVN